VPTPDKVNTTRRVHQKNLLTSYPQAPGYHPGQPVSYLGNRIIFATRRERA